MPRAAWHWVVAVSPEQRTWLIHLITTARFSPVRLGDGYLMSEVDQLLDRLVAELEAGRAIGALAAGARFTRVRWREAYRRDDVDELLQRLVAEGSG